MAPETIAIVGGGSVATSFLYHFVEELGRASAPPAAPPSIVIFEPAMRIGRGSAYADDLESNLLNVPVGGMSVAGNNKLHFSQWLREQGISTFRGVTIHDGAFVSRALFGQYLESVYADVVDRASALGVTIRHVRDEVSSIEQVGSAGLTLHTGATALQAGHVVLSIGNLPSPAFSHLGCHKHFHSSPYPVRLLVEQVKPDATVCILGTSLSAIDAILALAASSHSGKIVAVSRNGRLPSVRGRLNTPVQLHGKFKFELAAMKESGEQLTLDSLIALLGRELAESVDEWYGESIEKLAGPPSRAAEFLEEEIWLATSIPRQWQSFSAALNEVIDLLWHLLPAPERNRFLREVRGTLMARKGSFPLENGETLLKLVHAGRLEVLGGFDGVEYDVARGAFRVHILERSGDDKATAKRHLYTDCVVNATSFSGDVTSSTMPLLRSLIGSGAAIADRFGGLELDYDSGCVIDARGSINHRISALGTMATGTYFWTNAMEVNARLAMGQARRLARAWT